MTRQRPSTKLEPGPASEVGSSGADPLASQARQRSTGVGAFFRWLLVAGAIAFAILLTAWFFLPRPPLLEDVPFSAVARDRNGVLMRLTTASDQRYRVQVKLSEVPRDLILAVTTQEDHRYRSHFGVDFGALLRATIDFVQGHPRSGASTLTMQVARLRFHLQTRSIPGKLIQIYRALEIERHYSKDQILEAYFNLAPYGRNVEGISAASLIYFDKSPAKLSRQEILALAVLPQSPAKRTPRDGPEPAALIEARSRLNKLIWNDPLADLPLHYRQLKDLPYLAPHLVQRVLKNQNGETRLTVDAGIQRVALDEIQRFLASRQSSGLNNAACLLVDTRSMDVLASEGSGSFWNSVIKGQNDGTTQFRSPGSSLKPFVYAMALDRGLIGPSTLLYDVPGRFGNYLPENNDGKFDGPIPARLALVRSRNLPAVTLASHLGQDALYHFLESAQVHGLNRVNNYGLSAVLGTVDISMQDLVKLYAGLVNHGRVKTLRVMLSDPADSGIQLLSPEAAFITLDMMTTSEAGIRLPTAPTVNIPYKTGTSTGFRDAWCTGVIGRYVLAVWVGRFDGRSNPSLTGRTAAVPLFIRLASRLAEEKKVTVVPLSPPAGANVRQVDVCSVSGCLPGPYCTHTKKEWIIPGVSPITRCHIHTAGGNEAWDSEAEHFFETIGLGRKSSGGDGNEELHILPVARDVSWQTNQAASEHVIPLRARTPAGASRVYWFANRDFIGSAGSGETFYWSPAPGTYTIAATDDLGQSDSVQITVEGEK
ncbi:MAG: penicillin-binding protein 1C [Verrucomicrobia bacterium]|nr:penicillin-binding protein 1C [Verrucomicrobiota bacterium]MBV8486055.1 penicillin-binding protein 1C [Verrucomicrobiota bacterium]